MRIATALAFSTCLAALTSLTVWAQPSPPTEGVQLGLPDEGIDFRFPLNVTQCEPVFMYYNLTPSSPSYYLGIRDTNFTEVIGIEVPIGIGYIEWICNIPAGHGFIADFVKQMFYVVQPGSLSSCLHNVTTTYPYAPYYPTRFASYTANSRATTTPSISSRYRVTMTYVALLCLIVWSETHLRPGQLVFRRGPSPHPPLSAKFTHGSVDVIPTSFLQSGLGCGDNASLLSLLSVALYPHIPKCFAYDVFFHPSANPS